jgi:hypothetical protein
MFAQILFMFKNSISLIRLPCNSFAEALQAALDSAANRVDNSENLIIVAVDVISVFDFNSDSTFIRCSEMVDFPVGNFFL